MFVCWLVEGRYSGKLQFCTVLLKKHKRKKEEKKRKKKKKTHFKGADQKLYINVKLSISI